jgi:oxygen-independent coproporphyrinogen-3 oxidase
MWGCNLSEIEAIFGEEASFRFTKLVKPFLDNGKIIEKEDVYFLTDEGKLFADGIASDLFMEPENSSKG